ncbi:ThuA domain-containing protein [Christiangramia salexigens]|uniref:Crp/Fnr family transcriptional regulator n=1 Tax=Christiangramia salexigens TaxID=1913577 RepID=A0A1L3J6V8_9FLAO|nr:ThuA domain-containing protein [Christiangramia salexigens]APG60866.1 Crp/Fnr family transcriptional regulator [Christiangramia salexigens]
MRLLFPVLILILFYGQITAQKQVLVFHETQGYYHKSIPKGIKTIRNLGKQHDFEVLSTDDSNIFIKDRMEDIDLVIFLNTTGDVLNMREQMAFKDYIQAGGNFFGIHSAADTEYEWAWYGKLVGAYFKNHPPPGRAKIKLVNKDNPMVSHLPETWVRTDEWYNYYNLQDDIEVLLNLEESSYKGGENGDFHPIAWYKETGYGGVSIYTGGGHTAKSFTEALFREHLLRSILFALKSEHSIKP